MIRSLVVFCAALLSASCNVATVEQQASSTPQNQCESDSDCRAGVCRDHMCVTTKGTFDTVLFEISPPADSTMLAGVQLLKRVDGLLTQPGSLDLTLDAVAHVSGGVTTSANGCTPTFLENGNTLVTSSDHTIPVSLTVVPSAGALGLFASPITVESTILNSSTWAFKLNVPPGDYDVYIQPKAQPDQSCPVPPELLRGYKLTGTVDLSIELPQPQVFELHVAWPKGDGALDGWTADMLDSASGHVISNRVALSASGKKTDYVADLSYLPVVTSGTAPDPLVRISPPDGVTAPVVLQARSGLGLSSANSGTISELTLPSSVHISGQVTVNETPSTSTATVTLVATQLDGIEPGVFTSFVRTPPVRSDGTFDLDVLPGTYHVTAVPIGSPTAAGYAAATADWIVGATPITQAGRVIEIGNILTINGVADDPSGAVAMAGAQVQVVPSPASIVVDVLKQAIGEPTYVPRGNTSTVDSAGNFAVFVDAGTYDLSVRPLASSGYAWLVLPGMKVSAGFGLGVLNLPLPVSYSGSLVIPSSSGASPSPVPGALIDAYIYTYQGAYTSDSTQADSVLQIGEARTNQDGSFNLLIPASLNTPPSP